MDLADLIDRHPVLYHMAEDGTWPAIERVGLLSTTALVDRFQPPPVLRSQVLGQRRMSSIELTHPALGSAVVRDQLPLKFMSSVLNPGTTEQDFLDALNSRVFLWASMTRLRTLLGAKAYRNKHQTVLHVDTAQLLAAHPDAELAPYNTGSMHVPTAPGRGADVFVPVADYPYDQWAAKRGSKGDAVVEVTVPYAIPRIADYTFRVERWHGGQPIQVLVPAGA